MLEGVPPVLLPRGRHQCRRQAVTSLIRARPRRRGWGGAARGIRTMSVQRTDGHGGELRDDIVHIGRIGQQAPHVDDSLVGQRDHAVLTLFQRAEQSVLAGMTGIGAAGSLRRAPPSPRCTREPHRAAKARRARTSETSRNDFGRHHPPRPDRRQTRRYAHYHQRAWACGALTRPFGPIYAEAPGDRPQGAAPCRAIWHDRRRRPRADGCSVFPGCARAFRSLWSKSRRRRATPPSRRGGDRGWCGRSARHSQASLDDACSNLFDRSSRHPIRSRGVGRSAARPPLAGHDVARDRLY